MLGLVGGLLVATQWSTRIGMGTGLALMVACCATGIGKARKLCCDCVGDNGSAGDLQLCGALAPIDGVVLARRGGWHSTLVVP